MATTDFHRWGMLIARRSGFFRDLPVTRPATAARRRLQTPTVSARLEALALPFHLSQVADSAPNSRTAHFTVDDPDQLVRALVQSGRFRRDSRLGAMFHLRQVSLREVTPSNSLHICVGRDNRVSAHIDRYSPLSSNQPDHRCHYSLARIAAHNVAGMAADVVRLFSGR